MSDNLQLPPIENKIISGNFTLYAYAYRRLTKNELMLAVSKYMADKHIKNLPATGSAKLITMFGSNPADNI